MRHIARLSLALLVLGFAVGEARSAPTRVGAARVDITPDYPVRLTGYGNRQIESAGVAQRIWAKAIALGDRDPAVWIMIENCGLTPAIRARVVSELAKDGIPSDRLAISVTHTHTAPALTDWAPYLFGADIPPEHQRNIDRYTQDLIEKTIQVARQALSNRQPAELSWGTGSVAFAVNRRVLVDGKWTGFGVTPEGPVDHRLSLLAARDAEGKLVACVANYACHCTTLGGNFNQIAGDWAGYAQAAIEKHHPEAVALISIGCGADANPEPRRDDLAVCEAHGEALAQEAQRLLSQPMQPLTSPLQCRLIDIELPYAPHRTVEEWQELANASGVTGYHARKYLERLKAGEKLPTTLPYSVGVWNFGDDLAMVFLAGEVVVDYAIRLNSEFDGDRLWITAYTNDVPCYIPSRRILREGGYEADRSLALYARPAPLAPEVEDLVVDTVQKLLPHAFYSQEKLVDFPGPRTPEASLKGIRVADGFKVELVAAEPLIEDPVAFDWTADHRLFVAEMRDYPNGAVWEKAGDRLGVPGGRVKLLTDTDGDGTFDRADMFLEDIPFPNGVKAWRNGVLVTAVPDIVYAEDRDGDGRADHREVLFTGFAEGNQQHRANGLRWGNDGWLYVANGDSGGKIRSTKTGVEVSISGRDLRVRPDTGEIEAQSGQTQFGRCRNEWGDWFGGNNSNPLWHYVLEDHYLRRNPHVAIPSVRRDVPEVTGAAPVFPASRTLERFNDFHTANRFTSACSPEIYRDQHLTERLGTDGDHVFICEPVHNLVHREIMTSDGVSFRSHRAPSESQSEFFASDDHWCRPVMIRTAPDGSLWVADMYRQVIEHPEWIPQTFQRKLDLRAGSHRGRIYRISLQSESQRPKGPPLGSLKSAELVAVLDHSSGWQRDMAQQLLLERADPASTEPLEALAAHARAPATRLQALATLDLLRQLRPEVLMPAFSDAHPGVRRTAIRLAESRFTRHPELGPAVAQAILDPDPQVRLQAAYTLGFWNSPAAADALADLALATQDDPIMLAAVLSSLHADNVAGVTTKILTAKQGTSPFLQNLLATALALDQRSAVSQIAAHSFSPEAFENLSECLSVAASCLTTMRQKGAKLRESLEGDPARRLDTLTTQARTFAQDPTADVAVRAAAVKFLGASPTHAESDVELLLALLTPRNPPELQSAAVAAALERFPEPFLKQAFQEWRSHSPELRNQILEAVFTRPSLLPALLEAVASGNIPAAQFDARRRTQLVTHTDATIRERAESLLGKVEPSHRQAVLEQWQNVLEMSGDVTRGRAAFQKRCSVCHRLEEHGQNVGPDLMALTDKSAGALLVAILDPNRAVEQKFQDYIAVTDDGRQLTGMIAGETSTTVTLVGQEGKQIALQRNALESLLSSGRSLMPEGLEKDLTPQHLSDVIAYVRSVSQPAKVFPGNMPAVAHVRDDGSIRLLALNARIYGPTLAFQDQYRNLGDWYSADDHAIWSINVPKSGTYQVKVEYASPDASAGDRFVVATGEQSIAAVVTGTGSWDRYRNQYLGTLELREGPAEVVVRPDGRIRSALMDLRQITLQPQ